MIKNMALRISVDERGKIKTGKKSEAGLPQSLDYFNIEKFPELAQTYGLKPKAIVVFLPSNSIHDFFDVNYVLYAKKEGKEGVKVRQCDGERCVHRINEDVGGKKYVAGEETECICKDMAETIRKGDKDVPNPQRCKAGCYFKAYIASPLSGKVENPMCYLFETSSINSAQALYSELRKVEAITFNKLVGIPFVLSVRMISGTSQAMKKFPIWSLKPIGTIAELQEKTMMQLDEKVMSAAVAVIPESLPSSAPQQSQQSNPSSTFSPKGMKMAINNAKSHAVLDALQKSLEGFRNDGLADNAAYNELLISIEDRRRQIGARQ